MTRIWANRNPYKKCQKGISWDILMNHDVRLYCRMDQCFSTRYTDTLNRKRFDTNGKHAKLCLYIEVSIDGGTRKGMVYRGKSSINGWFRGSPIYGNPHIDHSPIKTSMTAFPLCHISNETGEKLDVLLFPRGMVINLYGFTCCRRNPIDDHGMTIAQQTTYLIRWKILPDDLH